MKYATSILLACSLLMAGCGGGTPATPSENNPPPAPGSPATAPIQKLAPELTVGDLETEVKFEVTLDPEHAPADVQSEVMKGRNNRITMLILDLEGAPPAELWFNIDLNTQLEFPDRPVVARGHVYREIEEGKKEKIFDFDTVFDENASTRKRVKGGDFPPQHFRVNALEGLSEIPDTMLVYSEMEVVFTEKGTDPATIDPSKPVANPDDAGVLLSNPVRINYNPPASAPAADTSAETPAVTPAEPPAQDATTAEAPAQDEAASTPTTETPADNPAESPATEAPAASPTDTPAAEAPADGGSSDTKPAPAASSS